MKWISFIKDNKQSVGILENEKILSLAYLGYDFKDVNDVILLEKHEYKKMLDKISSYSGEYIDVDNIKIIAPINVPFQDVFCVGLNYGEHIVEANQYAEDSFVLKPKATVYFSKRVNQTVSYLDDVSCQKEYTNKFDYETEVAVILKEDCKNCTKENVKEKIFGYAVVNDYSARDLQTAHEQWYLGKSLDGMFAMGPYILSINECINVDDLKVKTYVNDEIRQNSSTKYMIKSIDEIIIELSNYMTLKKGTIIATGTPSGVGMGFKPPKFLKEGDVVISEVEQLGYIKNKIV